MQGKKFAATFLHLFEHHGIADVFVRQVIELPHAPPEFNIRDCLNIKGKTVHYSTRRIHDNGKSQHQSGIVTQADMPLAYSESPEYSLTPFGPDHERPPPCIVYDTNIANPEAVRKARTHRLYRCFFCREAHCQESHWPLASFEEFEFLRHQYTFDKMLAKTIVGRLYPA